LLVNDNTADCNVSQEKRNYYETIHDGAIGIKETILNSAIGMESLFVGHCFLKQAKNRVSDWFFDATLSRADFLTVVTFSRV